MKVFYVLLLLSIAAQLCWALPVDNDSGRTKDVQPAILPKNRDDVSAITQSTLTTENTKEGPSDEDDENRKRRGVDEQKPDAEKLSEAKLASSLTGETDVVTEAATTTTESSTSAKSLKIRRQVDDGSDGQAADTQCTDGGNDDSQGQPDASNQDMSAAYSQDQPDASSQDQPDASSQDQPDASCDDSDHSNKKRDTSNRDDNSDDDREYDKGKSDDVNDDENDHSTDDSSDNADNKRDMHDNSNNDNKNDHNGDEQKIQKSMVKETSTAQP